MMRESVQSWTPQDPWPLIENNGIMEFDSNAFLSADQVLQLQDLFGQDDFDREASLLYDEFTFAPETDNTIVDTIEPSDLMHVDNIISVTEVPMTKRRRSSSCSVSSSISSRFSSSSSSSEDEEDPEETSHRRFSMSSNSSLSDSEPEQEIITPYLHRRQMEEMILDKITNHLDPEKLPGILAIISKAHEEEVEEVEIDLAKLDRDQLERILSYVNACLIEKEGGAKVRLSEYIIQHKPVVTQQPAIVEEIIPKAKQQPKSKNKRKNNNRRKSIIEEGHTVSGYSTSMLSSAHGPISMSALTELESKSKTSKNNKRKRRAKKNKRDEDLSVNMSTNIDPFKESIASTKPKRKSAIHKRRLLEEMLQPSNEDSSDDDDEEEEDNGAGIIVFGDEQMDMAVTQNETIVHQEQSSIISQEIPIPTIIEKIVDDEEEDDELIDIMM